MTEIKETKVKDVKKIKNDTFLINNDIMVKFNEDLTLDISFDEKMSEHEVNEIIDDFLVFLQ